jgi:hypothetical protein
MTDTGRAFRIYLYAACLISMLLLLFSVASALYAVVRIAAPGTTGSTTRAISFTTDSRTAKVDEDAERDKGTAQLIQSGILALVAGGVFAFHWTQAGRLETEAARPALPAPAETSPIVTPPPARQRRRRSTGAADGDES